MFPRVVVYLKAITFRYLRRISYWDLAPFQSVKMSNLDSTSPPKEGRGAAEPPAKLLGPAFSAFHGRYISFIPSRGFVSTPPTTILCSGSSCLLWSLEILLSFISTNFLQHLLLVISSINTPLNELREAIL
jgi:hypothetical protein